MIPAHEILEAAADKIAEPGRFTQRFTARKPSESPQIPGDFSCLATDPKATSWGGLGAIFAVGRAAGLRNADCYSIERIACQHIGAERLMPWATDKSQADVVSALRMAAQAERGRAVA